LTVRK